MMLTMVVKPTMLRKRKAGDHAIGFVDNEWNAE